MLGMRSLLAVGAAAAALAVLVACGGSTTGSGADAGSDGNGSSGSSGGSGSGSSSGSFVPGCPSAQPTGDNTACGPNGLQCEYGASPNPSCNELWECLNGTWSGGGPGSPGCPAGTCPAQFSGVPQGQACMPDGFDCAYAEGQCDCSSTGLGGTSTTPTWQCFQPAGCPQPRPKLGAACSQEGLSCDYGSCSGGVAETCTGGYWREANVACPG